MTRSPVPRGRSPLRTPAAPGLPAADAALRQLIGELLESAPPEARDRLRADWAAGRVHFEFIVRRDEPLRASIRDSRSSRPVSLLSPN